MLYDMTSGDQFRASGANWPSAAAHQQTVFYNSAYGPFSLFHDPGTAAGLYPAAAATGAALYPATGSIFSPTNLSGPVTEMAQQRFIENPAVIRPYFTPKLQFGLDVPPILSGVPSPFVDRGLTHLDLVTKTLVGGSRAPFPSPTEAKKSLTGRGDVKTATATGATGVESSKVASSSSPSSVDLVYIKSERDAVRECAGSNGVGSNPVNGDGPPRGAIHQSKPDRDRRRGTGPDASPDTWERKYSESNWNGNDKCNINVIDLSRTGCLNGKKATVKSESCLNEPCARYPSARQEVPASSASSAAAVVAATSPQPPPPSSSPAGCSRTDALCQPRSNRATSVSIKNEPATFHKYAAPTPFHLDDIFRRHAASRLDLLDKSESAASRPIEHDFLPRLNPCYFAGNLPLASQFPRWTDASFVNPFPVTGSATAPATAAAAFDFANPLGVKRETPSGTAATPGASSAPDGREAAGFICSRQTGTNAPDNVDFRLPPVGFEILRDPVTGKLLLIPAASIEALQRALFWPGYQPPALLPNISNGAEMGKSGGVVVGGAAIKEEEEDEEVVEEVVEEEEDACSVVVTSNQTPRAEETETRTQVTRNWLLEKAVKEEDEDEDETVSAAPHESVVDVSGLELLSRGIEKIERESTSEKKMTGLGLLCALAEQRMKDEIGEGSGGDDDVSDTGKTPKKIRDRRREVTNPSDMSPPVLEKATDFPPVAVGCTEDGEESSSLEGRLTKTEPPTLTPNTEEDDKVEFSVKREVDESEDNNNDRNNNTNNKDEEDEDGTRLRVEDRKRRSSPARDPESKRRKSSNPRLDPSSYLFRPIDPERCTRWKSEEGLSSFEIVRSEESSKTVASASSGRALRPRVLSESKAAASGEDGGSPRTSRSAKKHGKLILKLRREKRLSGAEETSIMTATEDKKKSSPKRCLLTTDCLMTDRFPIKILTLDGGLFYTGQLSAIQPPDVYGITIDGERGNRPHIYSREEILNNSILEVRPTSTDDLKPGTRICAYWSGQYRCLYPGSVSASTSPDPDPDDSDSVNVEFDDGDSCRISITDIRFLPENYPIVEYDPNPLQSLAKKKRKGIKTDESGDVEIKTEVKEERISPAATEATEDRDYLRRVKREEKKRESSDKHRKKHKKHKHKHGKKKKKERGDEDGAGETRKSKKSRKRCRDDEDDDSRRKRKKRKKSKRGEKSDATSLSSCQSLTSSSASSGVGVFSRKLWGWSGKGFRRAGVKGKARKEYYKAIQRGDERIVIGECAVFLSTGRPDRPFIGRIESMWETWGANMVVRVKWFYHPEETVGCPATLEYPGALFESPHSDENDVQTISHKCEVVPLKRYIERLGRTTARTCGGSTSLFYLAGFYDPTNTSLQFQEGVK